MGDSHGLEIACIAVAKPANVSTLEPGRNPEATPQANPDATPDAIPDAIKEASEP